MRAHPNPHPHLHPQTGKLYLSTSFLTFTSLDRRSCRLTLPLATIRRVEKLAPGQEGTAPGAFALGLTLFHGLRIVRTLSPRARRHPPLLSPLSPH